MTFDGFISYSHAADGQLAPAVQRGLHRLGKPWHRRRALWIFRDQTGLSVTPALWSSIQAALDGSEYFVLLASPEAARSPWVNREIDYWVATKSAGRVLPVLTDGDWRWDSERNDFTKDSTAVPEALRGVFAEEPLYLDLRWARDDRHLTLQDPRFREAIAQLAAPMHGMRKDDLESEDVRQHRRARRLRSTAAAVLVVLALVASLVGAVAVRKTGQAAASAANAQHQRQVALEQRGNAERSAKESRRQLQNAQTQEQRARDAAAETRRQQQLTRTQQGLAERAATEATRQQQNARRQQRLAQRAVALAREQEAVAGEQRELALQSGKEMYRQTLFAQQQQRLAKQATEQTRHQTQIAQQQQRLAEEATAEADRQQQRARQAAEEARLQTKRADQQGRIATGRRLLNQAKATIDSDPKTALMLGVAAQQVQPGAETRRELASMVASSRFAGTMGEVVAVAYGPPGILTTVDTDRIASLWNIADQRKPVRLAELGPSSDRPVFSPDGQTLAVIEYHENLNFVPALWDVSNPAKPVRTAVFPEDTDVNAVTFSPDSHTIATSDYWGAWTLWDVTDRSRPAKLYAPAGADFFGDAVAFSPDGHTMVTTNGTATIWDVTDPAHPLEMGKLDGIWERIAFGRTAPILATANDNETVAVWGMRDRQRPRQLTTLRGRNRTLALSADGTTLAYGDDQGKTALWDVSDPEKPLQLVDLTDQNGFADSIIFSPDGRMLTTIAISAIATLWNLTAYDAPKLLGTVGGTASNVISVLPGPDEHSLITVQADGTAVVWDVTDPASPVRRTSLSVHSKGVGVVARSPDGAVIAAASWHNEPVTLTEVADPARPSRLGNQSGKYITALAFSPDGHTLAVGDLSRVVLWDVTDRRNPVELAAIETGETINAIAWNPDGRTITVADTWVATVWDVTVRSAPTRSAFLTAHGTGVNAVAYSPDGRTAVTASNDNRTILWNVVDRTRPRKLAILTGHRTPDRSVAFAPDGRTLATGSANSSVQLWDIEDLTKPAQVADLRNLSLGTRSLMFNPDGHTLVAVNQIGRDGPATLWDFTDLNDLRADPARQACAITGRGLTADEWAGYLSDVRYQPTCPR